MKKCPFCKKLKTNTEFYKDKRTKDGLRYYCKQCNALKNKQYKRSLQWKEYNRNYKYNRVYNDINFHILINLRSRLYFTTKHKKKINSTLLLLGCSIKDFKKHLESKFQKGMSWNNYGKWHIDHIKPCCQFDLTKKSEQLKCFNYNNLQPLWAKENRQKYNKF